MSMTIEIGRFRLGDRLRVLVEVAYVLEEVFKEAKKLEEVKVMLEEVKVVMLEEVKVTLDVGGDQS